MELNVSKNCNGCTACVNICPQRCIEMKTDEEGFLYPIVEKDKCIKCGLCKKVCSIDVKAKRSEILSTYAAVNFNLDTRMRSSSGGVFALLAEKIISENGVVFGAVLAEDCKSVKHSIAHNRRELEKMFGSKYVQSDLGNVYSQVKEQLSEGKKVLFSGTPCQINGLHMFLRCEYENLLLVDIICHGVPSPALWSKYISYIEKRYHSVVKNVNFRSKKYGWQDFGIKRIDENNRELFISKNEDPYMQMFLKNYCLRQSCYHCSAKEQRYSDITIGDFWGIENVFPEMNDGKGASAVIVRTEKGRNIFEQVASKMQIKETEYQTIVQFNSAEIKSVYKPVERKIFFKDMNTKTFSALQRKYLKKTIKREIRDILIKMRIWSFIRPRSHRGGGKDNSRYCMVFKLNSLK